MNPARQASMAAKVPFEVPAFGINMVCGSGLRFADLDCRVGGDFRT